jgi:hypothetical protein
MKYNVTIDFEPMIIEVELDRELKGDELLEAVMPTVQGLDDDGFLQHTEHWVGKISVDDADDPLVEHVLYEV